jgi:hypothetical protein
MNAGNRRKKVQRPQKLSVKHGIQTWIKHIKYGHPTKGDQHGHPKHANMEQTWTPTLGAIFLR